MTHPDEMPADPDLDDLPPEVAQHTGPLYLGWPDPDTDEVYVQRPISREEVGTAVADERRKHEAEEK
jgi:hypothetical protein